MRKNLLFGLILFSFLFCSNVFASHQYDDMLAKTPEDSTIYYLYRGKKYPIPSKDSNYQSAILDSWGWEGKKVEIFSESLLNYFSTAENVTIRPGTYLLIVKHGIYAVEYCEKLRGMEFDVLPLLYGSKWRDRVVIVPEQNWDDYHPISVAKNIKVKTKFIMQSPYSFPSGVPVGSLLVYHREKEVWWGRLIGNNSSRLVTKRGLKENKFKEKFLINCKCLFFPEVIPSVTDDHSINKYHPELDFVSNEVNMETVCTIQELGGTNTGINYYWETSSLPKGIEVGKTLKFQYNDGEVQYAEEGVILMPFPGEKVVVFILWQDYLPAPYARQNYRIYKK